VNDGILFASQYERPINPADVERLYATVSWGDGRTDEGIGSVLQTGVAVGAWDGDRLIGFTRALSDGRYRAYVEDVMVDPEYRGKKVGERMVEELMRQLEEIEIVSLFCEPERVPSILGTGSCRANRR
jgi:ribosomal protein S18 acetylase RimI-like enzyme